MSAPAAEKTDPPDGFRVSKRYQRYVLGLLLLVSILSFVDRQLFAILLEPIRAEFGLSDTQLGLVSGLAFSLFYVTVGIPVAWLADRMNRRNIITLALGTWSLMTALCGMAGSFGTLFLARMGVGADTMMPAGTCGCQEAPPCRLQAPGLIKTLLINPGPRRWPPG